MSLASFQSCWRSTYTTRHPSPTADIQRVRLRQPAAASSNTVASGRCFGLLQGLAAGRGIPGRLTARSCTGASLPQQAFTSATEPPGSSAAGTTPVNKAASAGADSNLPACQPWWRCLWLVRQVAWRCTRLLAVSALLLLLSLLPRPKPARAAPPAWHTFTSVASPQTNISRTASGRHASTSAVASSLPDATIPSAKATAVQPNRPGGTAVAHPTAPQPIQPSALGGDEGASTDYPSASGAQQPLQSSPLITVMAGAPVPAAATSGHSQQHAADLALAEQLGILPHEAAVVRLYERCRGSIVNIVHTRSMQTFSTLDIHKLPHGQGSGLIWDTKGHVVTNFHLVKGASEVKVTLADHTTYTAKVVGSDAAKDLAVLKLSMPKTRLAALQPVVLGRSVTLRVGQAAYAIGFPWALDHSLTTGTISGLNRELSAGNFPIKNAIQVDCAINPGFSGGALLDSQGRVIGITTAIADVGGKGAYSGMGFAVPICVVKGLLDHILVHGRPMRPALGVTLAPAQVLQQIGQEGVLILEVPAGSPGHAAGLRPTHRDIFGDIILGDIVVGLDGRPVGDYAALYAALDGRRAGDRVRVDLVRDGKNTNATVTLGERVLGVTEE